MTHKIAKMILEHASTFVDRTNAVETAMSMGMPLSEIEEYLDWLEMVQADQPSEAAPPEDPASSPRWLPKAG
jgi:uncharacterized protein Yka (UPF0111/DUF47 family)